MSKWADYLITGVWRENEGEARYVSHVMLHKDDVTSFYKGVKTSKDDVIALIKAGSTVMTISWDYSISKWSMGAAVGYEEINGVEYLRSENDASVQKNINNLISMLAIG